MLHLTARYHLSTHISAGKIVEKYDKHEIFMGQTHLSYYCRCAAGKRDKVMGENFQKRDEITRSVVILMGF